MAQKRLIHARVNPKTVKISEKYFYQQVISRNPVISRKKDKGNNDTLPEGQFMIDVPYDGFNHFTRQAVEDVRNQLDVISSQEVEALVGHLALTDYTKTGLGKVLNPYGVLQLRVPVVCSDLNTSPELIELQDDRNGCEIKLDYKPEWPSKFPVMVEMELSDEQILETRALRMAEALKTNSFQRSLLLVTRITLNVPRLPGRPKTINEGEEPVKDKLEAKLVRMVLEWPTVTSFHALHLLTGEFDEASKLVTKSWPWQFNPYGIKGKPDTAGSIPNGQTPTPGGLEWKNIVFKKEDEDEKTLYYRSPWMILEIDQPGELYQQERLKGQAEVELKGQLWSGMEARLYNALGNPATEPAVQLTTRIIVDLEVCLEDAFNGRTFLPYQVLHFSEVIPSELRVADIRTALQDRGFRVEKDEALRGDNPPHRLYHQFLATWGEGLNEITLQIVVEGEQNSVRREMVIPGGQTNITRIPSGEVRVYIRGDQRYNYQNLLRELNALQLNLRHRFQSVQVKM